jgi:tetraacyldisaccharide 4'-kinase
MSERGPESTAHAWVLRWWRGEAGLTGALLDGALWPAERLFGAVTAARNEAYDRGLLRAARPTIPVVSVGNLSVGGAGKTPVAAWLAGRLHGWGLHPAIVLRGYADDEVKVHRELNPEVDVVVGKERAAAVAEAAGRGSDVAVVDDGFQHRALARDFDLVLVSADGWTARRRLLPRGPWRERVTALRRAGVAMVTRKAASRECAEEVAAALEHAVPGIPVVLCRIEPSRLAPLHGGAPRALAELSGREVTAVASLADPEPFRRNLEAAGARVEMLAFPDHHDFDRADANRILRARRDRPLLMTRKDAVKLRDLIPPGVDALVLEQSVWMERGGDLLDEALRKAVRR